MEQEVPFMSAKATLAGRPYVYTSILEATFVKWKLASSAIGRIKLETQLNNFSAL